MKKEISKMPVIEFSLSEIAKNIELMQLQSEKQQQMLLTMETNARERSAMRERTTKTPVRNAENVKGKENEASSSKTEESNRNFGNDRNEKKNEADESYSDRNKFKKVEMPVFTGEDPDSWSFRAERSQEEREKFTSWTNLKERMLVRFRSSKDRTISAQFLRIKQESTMEEYRNLFDKLVAPLSDLLERLVEDTFMNGLVPWIRAEVAFCRPKSLAKMMEVAQLVENREILRREANLNRCNEKYLADHKCKMEHRELRMFIVANDKEEFEIVEGKEVEKGELNKLEVKGDTTTFVELSINSVVSLNDPSTMKVRGKLQDEDVIILIDCGATHNFVSEKLVKKLLIPIKEIAHYGVILGSGAAVQGKGICEKLEIRMKNWIVKEDFLPLELSGVDIILGMQWLHSLGVTTVDWKNLLLTFSVEGKSIKIQGDLSLTKARVSLRNMIKAWEERDEGFLIECRAVEVVTPSDNDCYMANMEIEVDSTLSTVLKQFEDVFEWLEKLPPRREIEHQIYLKQGTDPINVRPYRYGFQQKEEMEKLVKEMLGSGVISPSTSSFSSPVLLVKKKDGSWRFCVDYKAVNNATILDKFPIPVVEELFDELGGAAVFSKIDLKSGYHQIRMVDEDIEKTAFRTHEGHYEFLVMPFGQDAVDHVEHMRNVLSILREHELYANKKKCNFAQHKVEYLGHIIFGEGVEVDPEKIKSITKWPKPMNIKEVRSFFGLTGYCRRFVQNYGAIAAPLTQLLKKGGYKWTAKAEDAFDRLKKAMSSLPVLALPDFNQPFEIETDALGYGVGAVLIQARRPIAYYSHTLSLRDRAWPVYERELMAGVSHPTVETLLIGRKIQVVYKPSAENRAADALSRMPTEVELKGLSVPVTVDLELIKKEVHQDPKFQKLIAELRELEDRQDSKYSLQNDVLKYKDRLVITKTSSLIPTILDTYHNSVVGGHSGFLRTYKRVSSDLDWEGMKADIKKHCEECLICQRNKSLALSPAGLLVPLEILQAIWNDISMDFVEGLPKASGFEVILLLQERDSIINALKENLVIAQNWMKKQVDLSKRDLNFQAVDEVYLKLRPYRQRSLEEEKRETLTKIFGPYQIIKRIGEVAYRLELPPEASVRNVLHISQQKLKLWHNQQVQHQFPTLIEEFELQLSPELVLGIRWNGEIATNE
ncbi:Transposon Ty3-I Gag-Pol polyprotein [Cucumis melo var. makuwa]|uniref:Transposon Ty3-I Gag-Pol polyprotein n=1 Tax=Cucumis melo var. makuwa TaxID=1194695 RepID=A0A5D3BUJ8_CUCMM|nr:Transposon Ty3-I Gag-Pol polyprotein [Cucumis melo var. makuwa]